jgi:hypothetical protein
MYICLFLFVVAASLYDTNREEYERVASETFNANCAPRNGSHEVSQS